MRRVLSLVEHLPEHSALRGEQERRPRAWNLDRTIRVASINAKLPAGSKIPMPGSPSRAQSAVERLQALATQLLKGGSPQ